MSLALDRKILTTKVFGDSTVPKGFVSSGLAYDPASKRDFADDRKWLIPSTTMKTGGKALEGRRRRWVRS